MTIVLYGKGLLLEGSNPKMEDKQVLLTGVIHQLEIFFLVFWRLAGCHHPQTEDGTLTSRNSFFESTPKKWALEQFGTREIKEK